MSHATINTWKSIMNTGNHKELINIIHENATFHSPVVFTPQEGKKKVIKYAKELGNDVGKILKMKSNNSYKN